MAGDRPAPTGAPRIPETDLILIATAYRLGDIQHVSYLTAGTMNHNWRLTTSIGDFALKRLLDVTPADARRSAEVLTALQQRRLPVAPPALTTSGDRVCQIEGRAYCLLPWIIGHHPTGADLTREQVTDLGALIGRIHQALNGPATGLATTRPTPPTATVRPEAAIAEARRYQRAATSIGGPWDLAVAEALEQRIALIDQHATARPRDDPPRGPYGWTHGDIQPRNVLWRDGRIAAVIDWDRLRPRPYLLEVVRTATIQFATAAHRLDLDRISAFVRGYRSVVTLDESDLADGVRRLWWTNLTDLWHLRHHYDRHNVRCDDLFLADARVLCWWTDHYPTVLTAFTRP